MRKYGLFHGRPSVRSEKPHPEEGEPVYADHSGSKGINLDK